MYIIQGGRLEPQFHLLLQRTDWESHLTWLANLESMLAAEEEQPANISYKLYFNIQKDKVSTEYTCSSAVTSKTFSWSIEVAAAPYSRWACFVGGISPSLAMLLFEHIAASSICMTDSSYWWSFGRDEGSSVCTFLDTSLCFFGIAAKLFSETVS